MATQVTENRTDQIAFDWVALKEGRSLTSSEQVELDQWLADDVRHFGAYARAKAVLSSSQRIRALGPDFVPDEYLVRQDETQPDVFDIAAERRAVRQPHRWVAAGLAMAASVALVFSFLLPGSANDAVYATQVGERRAMTLADSSSIEMNTDTRLAVDYDDDQRTIRFDQGEALFSVERDVSRPFIVEAGNTRVHVLGTVFSVRRIEGQPVEVLVLEGRVRVERNAMLAGKVEFLEADQRALVAIDTPQIAQERLLDGQAQQRLAWREGMIAFEDVTLSDAAREFARYGNSRIRFGDPEIAEQTVTGLFDSSDPAGFARAVAQSLGLQARNDGAETIIERRSNPIDPR
ncbi:FecR domain-containing protein [Altererythrobacter sp. ZODW24]|uniref:FecR family protein n=1 Tax=Altererythrobacter sp. ZODW24 TaxID=2185142 RepID=UPI0013B45EBD|nr:FecR domain-containing protein [Altererythrobacter sp. ZODW24]